MGAPVTLHVRIHSENSIAAPTATVTVGRAPIAEIGGEDEVSSKPAAK
jgi:hypothetical protein